MTYSLWPHQADREELLTSGSAILWHEMRTGKTRTALHAWNQLYNQGKVLDLIFVTVAMAKTTIKQEIEEMGLGIEPIMCFGKKALVMKGGGPADASFLPRIFIINWEILPYWQQYFHETTRDRNRQFVLVLDESHLYCRNPDNQRYKAAHWLARFAFSTWLLTGTIQSKSGLDLYHQLGILDRRYNPFHHLSEREFGDCYCYRSFNPYGGFIINQHTKQRSGSWDYQHLRDPDEVVSRLSCLSTLRIQDISQTPLPTQLPCWISDLGQHWDYRRGDTELAEELAALIPIKVKLTVEYVAAMPQRPVIIFGWNVAFTETVAAQLEAPLIKGDTSLVERERIRQDFQSGRIPVLVGNFRSLGLGVSLSRADHFVYGQPWYDASLYLQAMARGLALDKKTATVHHHLLVAGSAEEYVWKRRLDRGQAIERLYEATSRAVPDMEAM